MFTVRATLKPDYDILDAIAETAQAAPKAMQRQFARDVVSIKVDMLNELQVEPQPASDFYPLPWDSARQRRAVMAKLREQGGPPHRRGRGSRSVLVGYRVILRDNTLIAENLSPHARWVVGDDARRMFLLIGWVQFAPVVAKYRVVTNDRLIDGWAKVSMPKARKL